MNDQLDDYASSNVFGPMLETENYSLPTLELDDHSYIPFPRLIDHFVLTTAAETTFPTIDAAALALEETINRYTSRVSDHRPVETVHIPRLPL